MYTGVFNKFNRGEVDQRALTRDELKSVNDSCASMVNFMPSRLGNMQYRGGTEYIASLDADNTHYMVPFIDTVSDTSILDFYNNKVEFIVNDTQVATTAVTSTLLNGTFASNITSWTVDVATVAHTADEGGSMSLIGTGTVNAVAHQTILDASLDNSTVHYMSITIKRAPCVVRVGTGTSASATDLFDETLKVGEHVISFTAPASGDMTITFENDKKYATLVSNVAFLGAGTLSLTTEIATANLESIRYVQSNDVVFICHDGGKPIQIEHRGDIAWSVVDYRSDDGAFLAINTTPITMAPTALDGDTVLTASKAYFNANHVGALMKVASTGQQVVASVTAENTGTDGVLVTGANNARIFTIAITGTWVATVTLQRSTDEVTWEDVESYTANVTKGFDDTFDDSILYYRLFCKTGDFTSGTISLDISYPLGSITGICRIYEYTSSTSVKVQVLKAFGSTDATDNWYEGAWSDNKEHPKAVEIAESRLWFSGADSTWGSVSDSFYSFDPDVVGDSKPIQRTIGFGATDPIKWIKSAGQLILGSVTDELVLRSSSYGDILTQTNANLKSGSTQGSGNSAPIKIDKVIYFEQRSGKKIYGLINSSDSDEVTTKDATMLNQDILNAGVKRMFHTQQPENRIYVVLDDGTVAVYTIDLAEEVGAWSRFETAQNGVDLIKDVVVLPSADEDVVYFVISRTVDGTTYNYLEKLAKFKNALGGTISETFDSFKRYTSPTATITGLSHLEGETVGVWADGLDRGTYTVASGQITASGAYTDVIVGLPYVADYISNKLADYETKTVLTQRKRIVQTGLVLMDYSPAGLTIGDSVANLKPMPSIEDGKAVGTATISDYSKLYFEFDGDTEPDPRIYIRATKPVTVLALTYGIVDSENEYRTID